MLNSDGVIRDTFQLIKRGRVELAHIAKPKSPQPFIGRTLPLPRIPSAGRSTPDKGAVMPEKFTAVIPRGAEWQYLGGTDPGAGWSTSLEGDWKTGQAGFGYEDDDDVTKITGMQGKYKFLCIRRAFELTGREDLSRLGLAISFDDGFICYLNGNEVARANVKSGSLQTATGVESHETKGFKFFPLRQAQELLKPGRNMIAFEIHNDDIGSSDLTIDPYLILTEAAATAEGGKPHSDLSSDE